MNIHTFTHSTTLPFHNNSLGSPVILSIDYRDCNYYAVIFVCLLAELLRKEPQIPFILRDMHGGSLY